MENASKALIIAGAIILSILIIALGMAVFNMASNPAQDAAASIESQAAQAFNSTFEPYIKTNITGSSVRSLYDAVRQNNVRNASDESMIITIDGATTAADINTKRAAIQTGKRYDVTADYSTSTGYITTITVTEAASGSGGSGSGS